VLAGAMARLMNEDWAKMTEAANKSEMHVASRERWYRMAREANPSLDEEQVIRLGEMMRTEHYRRMGRLSAQARKLARQAKAELDRGDQAGEACAETA
jgi:hypothetical protein